MRKFLDAITKSFECQLLTLTTVATQCFNLYIQASQAEPDLKENAKIEEFISAFNRMMEKVVNPLITADRSNRSKFRSITHYSRSVK
ncbi:hypothetical protein TVAG_354790 [Trichomonas vaginalis G3]|uniref:Uncharacterized protein n=1 Tax=Trichomonas vaginalis (strain ATCC PRA-98 / G3) TaxID=412133 RepID=A2EFW4_TRIV3|nr:hypothetical protein TVAGG3_0516240 [Trichomonas vaginalis G3]EAY08420.1 hypothetical protein TVAG_354790 [Trichomonas vaginalis G3]KAI5518148.1 hypothetical protein TVAGG3_0516240 [Trichomonas vaginalis G3]|eukprot:XP_001320643.1 hypothetical protein [Trichomonas vaginalis G3]